MQQDDARALVMACIEGRGERVVYFAHSRLAYGTKPAIDARRAVDAARPGWRILDPSKFDRAPSLWDRLVSMLGSHDAVYQLVVSCCDEVVAAEHNGFIGRGVYCELVEAMTSGRACHIVRGGALLPVAKLEPVDMGDWRRRYARVITGS